MWSGLKKGRQQDAMYMYVPVNRSDHWKWTSEHCRAVISRLSPVEGDDCIRMSRRVHIDRWSRPGRRLFFLRNVDGWRLGICEPDLPSSFVFAQGRESAAVHPCDRDRCLTIIVDDDDAGIEVDLGHRSTPPAPHAALGSFGGERGDY